MNATWNYASAQCRPGLRYTHPAYSLNAKYGLCYCLHPLSIPLTSITSALSLVFTVSSPGIRVTKMKYPILQWSINTSSKVYVRGGWDNKIWLISGPNESVELWQLLFQKKLLGTWLLLLKLVAKLSLIWAGAEMSFLFGFYPSHIWSYINLGHNFTGSSE